MKIEELIKQVQDAMKNTGYFNNSDLIWMSTELRQAYMLGREDGYMIGSYMTGLNQAMTQNMNTRET